MSRKLDNAAWEEYINKFDSLQGSKTVIDFCVENELTKVSFTIIKRD
ncbi:hypothetical protein [Clostridium grantii]|uniref:Uncharacterized protein n=1 Tax=Clostridium grantii DSM 8605 TaxID=1121316 RepID=A0A1M5SUJ2_9CLOT|nr:hypothetical protein [Clostridium grantii]SHH42195.1 hypothetical protein SAMN02745207_01042 [Clostridium grantii DSM 8605]